MAEDIEIDAQGEHGYVVTQPSELEDVRTWFKVTPEVMDQLGADDEEDVVVQFLPTCRGLHALPPLVLFDTEAGAAVPFRGHPCSVVVV